MPEPAEQNIDDLTVRTYQPQDHADILRLFDEGLLAGQVAPNDTGADIEHVQEAYFDQDRHHFWVAEYQNKIVGMIGVGSDEEHTAEIRRLRVQHNLQHTNIATLLLQTALDHCKTHGYLKVLLDTRFERDEAVGLFDKVGFQHTRTRNIPGKDLLEFYLDIYRQNMPGEE
ncbi:GNAT family N-acetyltransferase [Poriferisphaera sp. WC338]|uniref:GNAT family N-acetyltransferase n=1 Tax=Poriferisphaera sp. WC338 TaxID=3425129 RepID=UPI003D81A288